MVPDNFDFYQMRKVEQIFDFGPDQSAKYRQRPLNTFKWPLPRSQAS